MSQPHILVVDLPNQADSFIQALAKVGRKAQAVSASELAEAFEQLNPIAIVAPFDKQSEVAAQIRVVSPDFQFPAFVLEKKIAGSMRPLLPEITARLPDDVDPGILAMRLQIALQNARGTYSRRQTVVGIPSVPPSGAPPAASTAPTSLSPKTAPAAALLEQPVTGATLRGSAPPPPVASSPFPSASAAASSTSEDRPSEHEANSATSTAPGIAPPADGSAPSAAGSSPTPSESPLAPEATEAAPNPFPSAPSNPSPSTTEGSPASPNPFPTAAPSSPFPSAETPPPPDGVLPEAPMTAEAAPAGSPPGAEMAHLQEQKAAKAKLIRYGAIGAGAGALVIAAISLFAGGDQDSATETETAALAAKEEGAADQADKPAAKQPNEEHKEAVAPATNALPTQAEADAKKAKEENTDSKEADATSGDAPASEADFFKIENAVEGQSCEDVLGHPAQYYAKTAQWRSGHAWKLARKNLVAGHEEEAHKQMCRSAFIDVRGSGTSGLVKYYLSKRALSQALVWAKAGADAKEGGRSEARAMQLLGDVLIQMGQIKEAKAAWLEGLGITEEDTVKLQKVCSTFYTSGLKTRRGGDSHFAEQLLRRAAAFQPDNPAIAAELAKTLLANEQPKLAKLWADRALSKDGSNDTAKAVLAGL